MCSSAVKFDAELQAIKSKFPDIDDGHIGCYLCNFEDSYICKEHNGGCKSISKCQEIHKQMN